MSYKSGDAPKNIEAIFNLLDDVMKDSEHGSPFDRGGADYYYWRPKNPHKYPNGSYVGDPVTDLTDDEIAAYNRGYDECWDRKDWG